jgi:ABC-type branched-subunit amino acid transport system substrate-binding protein
VIAVAVVVGLLVVGGVVIATSSSGSSDADAGGSDGSVAAARTAGVDVPDSSTGVSDSQVRVGVLVADVGSAQRAGVDVESDSIARLRAAYETFAAQINDQGGIEGRTIDLVFQTFDPISEDSLQTACLALTEDAQVFAVLQGGGFYGPAELCISRDHRTLFLDPASSTAAEYYAESAGLMFSAPESLDRALAVTATVAADDGVFDGKKVGVLSTAYPTNQAAVTGGLLPALQQVGVTDLVQQQLPSDFSAAAAQVPLAVATMRDAGAEVVVLTVNQLQGSQFVQAADAQGYHPLYVLSDAAGGATDLYVEAMPDSFQALAVTSRTNIDSVTEAAAVPTAQACLDAYDAAGGPALGPDDTPAGIVQACTAMRLLEVGARGAGPALTTRSFSEALSAADPFEVGTVGGNISFADGFDGAQVFRRARFDAGCRCWAPDGGFEPVPTEQG